MARRFGIVTGRDARATLAAALLAPEAPARLGSIALAPHQVTAVLQLRRLLRLNGGALLADDVGLGKTFVALALAAAYRHAVAVIPAALRDMWASACQRADVRVTLLTYEALSRRAAAVRPADLVIFDEAHHAASTTTQRYPRIAALTAEAHTLLLSATPFPNRVAELRALFALFLGEQAETLDPTSLGALIVRRVAASVPSAVLPHARAPLWIETGDDSACLAQLQSLPPPVPAADEGDAGALVLLGLVRQWASSRTALVAAIRRRVARADAMEAALRAGRRPTSSELRAWHAADDSVQLAFPELVAPLEVASGDGDRLLDAVIAHRAGLRRLLATIRDAPDPDDRRVSALLELRTRHPDARVLCFTGYAETALGYWRRLRQHPRVALLTARGGMIASGSLGRAQVLDRFAPLGQRAAVPRPAHDITLLVTTDILSEGLDLRDATVIVHLDLPWSPTRLEQRVGRARRLGSAAGAISVYAMRPPSDSELLVGIERRLQAKIAVAAAVVGTGGLLLPSSSIAASIPSGPECRSRMLDRIAGWGAAAGAVVPVGPRPVVATVASRHDGWLALVTADGAPALVARVDGATVDAPHLVEAAVVAAEDADVTAPEALVADAIEGAGRYAGELAARGCIGPRADGPIRRRALRRIDSAYARAGPQHRAAIAALAAAARAAVVGRLTAGLEHQLASSCDAPLDDVDWLRAVSALRTGATPETGCAAVEVMIVLVRAPTADGRGTAARAPAPASMTPS